MSTLARLKVWVTGDTLTASDLNGEFNNIVNDYNGSVNSSNIGTLTGTLTMTMSANSDVISISKSGSGAGNCLDLTNAGTDPTITSSNTSTGGVLSATANSVTTGNVVALTANGLTTGSALSITNNSSSTGSRNVVEIIQDHASASGATALKLQQDGDAVTLSIVSASTTDNIINIPTADALTSGAAVSIISNSSSATDRDLIYAENTHASAVSVDCVSGVNSSTGGGNGIRGASAGTGAGVRGSCSSTGVGVSGSCSTAGGNALKGLASSASFTGDVCVLATNQSTGTSFDFLECIRDEDGTPDVEYRLAGNGQSQQDGTVEWTSGAADYAEMFECQAPNGIDVGYFVTYAFDQSNLIKRADSGEDILGVVSGSPACIADTGWNKWAGKYLKDEFGRHVEKGGKDRVLNPQWDKTKKYIPRKERPEWVPVGLLGKINVRTSEDVYSNYVKAGYDGHAVNADEASNGSRWRVLEVVRQKSDDPDGKGYGVVRILFK